MAVAAILTFENINISGADYGQQLQDGCKPTCRRERERRLQLLVSAVVFNRKDCYYDEPIMQGICFQTYAMCGFSQKQLRIFA